jgi:transcriptional regulator with XRE-family HTH domain
MKTRGTTKKNQPTELPPLCVAVKRLRELYDDTQERFARRLNVANMTVSKFETGRTEPRDPRVLLNLHRLTADLTVLLGEPSEELDDMGMLFYDAYKDIERIKRVDKTVNELFYDPLASTPSFRSLREWRLACGARIALLYFPELVTAVEKAAAPAFAIVDEVLRKVDENQTVDYRRLETEVFSRAELHALKELKGKNK